jgi:non-ribosomal peptide synthase protein (TIGR01720 family)
MLPIQRWFFEQDFPNPHHWNQSVMLDVPRAIDMRRLELALAALVDHHLVFRYRFRKTATGWQQWLAAPVELRLEHIDLSAEPDPLRALELEAERAQRSLHIERGPLARFVHFKLATADRLLVVLHHLISDTVSLRILFEDLQRADQQLRAARPIELLKRTTSYAEWSALLHEHATTPALASELSHWQETLGGAGAARLPAANPEGENRVGTARTLYAYLTLQETAQLLKHAPAAYRTEITELLLTALAQTLCAWSGQAQLRVEIERHGREDLFEGVDVSRTVGWFSAPQVAALSTVPNDIEGSIRQVRAQLRVPAHHGIGYGLTRYVTEAGRTLAAHAMPPVFFNYLGQFDQMLRDEHWLQPTDDPRGEELCPDSAEIGWFGVGGAVERGRLRLEWRFSTHLHHENTAQELLEDYTARLRALIAHCVQVVAERQSVVAAE